MRRSLLARHVVRPVVVGFLTAGFVAVLAAPAFAHSSRVTHVEHCSADGVTTTVVTFNNDYGLTAVVTYHWGSDAPTTANLAARTTTVYPTVSLPSHVVGTLKYHVTWSDNYRQPSSGDTSLTIAALPGCVPPTTSTTTTSTTTTSTTTTSTSTTTTTAPPVTTTTALAETTTSTAPAETTTSTAPAETTTSTAPAATTTTTTAAPTTTTTVGTKVLGETVTAPPASGALPHTGFDLWAWLLPGVALLVAGLALQAANRRSPNP